jgi:hypothetical protein
MSRIAVGSRGGAAATTAITVVALILMMASSSSAILTTQAFAAPTSNNSNNKDCKDIQFRALQSSSYSTKAGNTITIGTSQNQYSVKMDYFKDSGDEVIYFKNVGAKDPKGHVLLPGGETITITLKTNEPISGNYYGYRTDVTLYNHKVSDCDILIFGRVNDADKMDFEIVSIEQTDESPIVKLTVQVPDASDVVDKHFTKLLVTFPFSPEAQEYYLISDKVQVS